MTNTTMTTRFITAVAGLTSAVLFLLAPPAVETRQSDSIRTIDVQLSRYAFSPERIEVRLGERVRLNVVSADSTHGFQLKELGLKVKIPSGAKAVAVDLEPTQAGTFQITCSEYCGSGHRRMKASLIVTPRT